MTFIRKHRDAILAGLGCALLAVVACREQLFTFADARPLRWSKEYVITGSRPDLEHAIEEIRHDAFEACRGSWTGGSDSQVRLIKVELRGAK